MRVLVLYDDLARHSRRPLREPPDHDVSQHSVPLHRGRELGKARIRKARAIAHWNLHHPLYAGRRAMCSRGRAAVFDFSPLQLRCLFQRDSEAGSHAHAGEEAEPDEQRAATRSISEIGRWGHVAVLVDLRGGDPDVLALPGDEGLLSQWQCCTRSRRSRPARCVPAREAGNAFSVSSSRKSSDVALASAAHGRTVGARRPAILWSSKVVPLPRPASRS